MIYGRKNSKNSTHYCWKDFNLIEYIEHSLIDNELKQWALKKNKSRQKDYKKRLKFDFFLTILIHCSLRHPRTHPVFDKQHLYFNIHKN